MAGGSDQAARRYLSGPLGYQARPLVIDMQHVSALYQGRLVLKDISLRVPEGTSVLIQGQAGAGKSMLIACLQGLLQIAAGQARVLGALLPPLPKAQRLQIGVLPHVTSQVQPLTALEWLARQARAHEVTHSESWMRDYLRHYSLAENGLLAQLTSLQRRTLELSATLLHDPSLVLLDEPLVGLPKAEWSLIDSLQQQMRNEGRTLLVTSTPSMAEPYAQGYDIIISLEAGKVLS